MLEQTLVKRLLLVMVFVDLLFQGMRVPSSLAYLLGKVRSLKHGIRGVPNRNGIGVIEPLLPSDPIGKKP